MSTILFDAFDVVELRHVLLSQVEFCTSRFMNLTTGHKGQDLLLKFTCGESQVRNSVDFIFAKIMDDLQ